MNCDKYLGQMVLITYNDNYNFLPASGAVWKVSKKEINFHGDINYVLTTLSLTTSSSRPAIIEELSYMMPEHQLIKSATILSPKEIDKKIKSLTKLISNYYKVDGEFK